MNKMTKLFLIKQLIFGSLLLENK